ncbi:MAG: acyltransferase, partial [Betaproteobacteria bacterium]
MPTSSPAAPRRVKFLELFDLESGGTRIPAMEGLRAYAVLLTFCVHFFGAWLFYFRHINVMVFAPHQLPRNTDRILLWLQLSPYGVYLFFILSGFLICRLVGGATHFSYLRFLWRRLCRIYPAFILALLLGVAVFTYYAGGQPFSWSGLGANLLLLNGVREFHVEPILHQTWSLFFEVVFYIVFPLLLLLRPLGLWRFRWSVAIAGVVLVYLPFALGWGQALFLLFFAGATAARYDDAQLAKFADRMPRGLVIVLYLSVTTAIAFRVLSDHVAIWFYGVAGVLLMIETCYGTGWLNKLFAQRWLRRMGNVSYSLFLTHIIPIYFVIAVIGPKLFHSTGLGAAFAAAA